MAEGEEEWGDFWDRWEQILPIRDVLKEEWIYPSWYGQEDKEEHAEIMKESASSLRDRKLMAFAKKMRKKKRLAQNRVSTSL